jgi:hypothetical protein|tara:strand:+ start:362 stop:487 length:126 start_codon:yes stop_codon:yes gene_type:complete
MIGIAKVQSAFEGLFKKESRRDLELELISTSLELTGINPLV